MRKRKTWRDETNCLRSWNQKRKEWGSKPALFLSSHTNLHSLLKFCIQSTVLWQLSGKPYRDTEVQKWGVMRKIAEHQTLSWWFLKINVLIHSVFLYPSGSSSRSYESEFGKLATGKCLSLPKPATIFQSCSSTAMLTPVQSNKCLMHFEGPIFSNRQGKY